MKASNDVVIAARLAPLALSALNASYVAVNGKGDTARPRLDMMHQSWLGVCAPTDTFVVGLPKRDTPTPPGRSSSFGHLILGIHEGERVKTVSRIRTKCNGNKP